MSVVFITSNPWMQTDKRTTVLEANHAFSDWSRPELAIANILPPQYKREICHRADMMK